MADEMPLIVVQSLPVSVIASQIYLLSCRALEGALRAHRRDLWQTRHVVSVVGKPTERAVPSAGSRGEPGMQGSRLQHLSCTAWQAASMLRFASAAHHCLLQQLACPEASLCLFVHLPDCSVFNGKHAEPVWVLPEDGLVLVADLHVAGAAEKSNQRSEQK